MDLITRIRRYIARHRLANPQTRVVVAVSGGSDSVALAHVVRALDAAGELRAAGIVHFNHQLRESARRDEDLTIRLAESFGWRMAIGRGDVAARARRERRSIEYAARAARYEFFEQARTDLGGDVVALGHTRDDQAETFLLRLLRGAGPKGLAAMHPRHRSIVRPLLAVRRGALRDFLAANHIEFADDESNLDVTIPRNRVRAELLPLLECRFNPAIVDVLADEAALARDVWQWMEEAADFGPETSDFDVAKLKAVPPALARFVLWRAMSGRADGKPVSFRHVEAAMELLECDGPGSIDLPGQSVERIGPRLVLRSRASRTRAAAGDRTNFFDYPLSIPGEVPLPEVGCILAAEPGPDGFDIDTFGTGGTAAVVRRDLCIGSLRVRNRRPGDRFRPVGVGGRKKLQDFFVDRKVERPRRDQVPLVVDRDDRIVWVAGFGIDDAFRVTDPAQSVVILRLKLLGGSA